MLPSLQALYQIHYNTECGDPGNTKPDLIANPKDNPNKADFIKATIQPDKGAFTLQIGPAGEKRTYNRRSQP